MSASTTCRVSDFFKKMSSQRWDLSIDTMKQEAICLQGGSSLPNQFIDSLKHLCKRVGISKYQYFPVDFFRINIKLGLEE